MKAAQQTIVIDRPPDSQPAPAARVLAPALFELGSATLTALARESIQHVPAYLRSAPAAAVLLWAHTDTSGILAINVPLVSARAEAVRDALVGEGGIAPNRIFIASLAENDLTTLTGPKISRADNRTVEFLVVTLQRP